MDKIPIVCVQKQSKMVLPIWKNDSPSTQNNMMYSRHGLDVCRLEWLACSHVWLGREVGKGRWGRGDNYLCTATPSPTLWSLSLKVMHCVLASHATVQVTRLVVPASLVFCCVIVLFYF